MARYLKNDRIMKTSAVITDLNVDKPVPQLDIINVMFIPERDTITIHSPMTNIDIGININTFAEFININRPDLFEPF